MTASAGKKATDLHQRGEVCLDEGEVLVLLQLPVLPVAALWRLRPRPLGVGARGRRRAQPLLLAAVTQVLQATRCGEELRVCS